MDTKYGEAAAEVSQGQHKLAIEVKGNAITAWLDEKQIITASHEEIGKMEKGRLLIAGQFPLQDFALDNLLVTTNEELSGKECTVNLEIYRWKA